MAVDARDGLRAIATYRPQVLLLDMMLPDMDGREVLKELQAQPSKSLRCVLAVSGDVTEKRLQEVKALGADDLVPKPVNVGTLVARIRELVVNGQTQR